MYFQFNDGETQFTFVPVKEDISERLEEPIGRLICIYKVIGFEEDIYVIDDRQEGRILAMYECLPDLFTFLKEDNRHILVKIKEMLEIASDLIEWEE